MSKKQKFYSAEFKAEAIKAIEENKGNVSETVRQLALLQIAADVKLNSLLAKGSAYESLPWSAFSGRNHSLGCALVL